MFERQDPYIQGVTVGRFALSLGCRWRSQVSSEPDEAVQRLCSVWTHGESPPESPR